MLLTAGLWPAPAAADPDPWGWPLAGAPQVGRPFTPPLSRYTSGHRGVDLPAEAGALVTAAGAGRVSYAGLLAGRGVVVVVHGALRTTYEPVTATVSVGQSVALGEPLGQLEVGHAGCAVPACLHWGLRRGEEYLDPTRRVVRGPSRLLPLARTGTPEVSAPWLETLQFPVPVAPREAPTTASPPTAVNAGRSEKGGADPGPLAAAALASGAGLAAGAALMRRSRP